MSTALGEPWFQGQPVGARSRIMFVTACGAAAIVAAYICTNILINQELVRTVRLLAQGTFTSTLPPLDPAERPCDAGAVPCDSPGPTGRTLEERCRSITLAAGLTPREYDVLVILSQGNSMARVQRDLVISEGTAITHRRNLYRKLGVTSKQELIDYVNRAET